MSQIGLRHIYRASHNVLRDNASKRAHSFNTFQARTLINSKSPVVTTPNQEVVLEHPIKSLNIESRISKTKKTGLFSGDSLISRLHADALDSKKGLNYVQTACMSYDSSNKVHSKIHRLINDSKKKVFVFMKGVPAEPLCRYSGVVVQVLDAYGVEFDSCDVLEDADIRQEIKSYSDWPTIPQVYLNGTFVGGCDILLQMHQSGELKQLFSDSDTKNTENDQQKP